MDANAKANAANVCLDLWRESLAIGSQVDAMVGRLSDAMQHASPADRVWFALYSAKCRMMHGVAPLLDSVRTILLMHAEVTRG